MQTSINRSLSAQIVVPCLNEELSIPGFLNELKAFRQTAQAAQLQFDFIFVDNGSTDHSFSMLTNHCQLNPSDQLFLCTEKGYGSALKFGFSRSTSELIGFLDLDCTYPLVSLIEMHNKIALQSDLDIVIANRMTKSSKMPFLRAVGNTFYVFIIAIVYRQNLKDACSGMRLFRNIHLPSILRLKNNGLGFSIELTCMTLIENWTYRFVDISYNERCGASKLNVITDGFSFLNQIFYSKRIQYDKS